jgi:ubiquitin-activating enzyme E1
VALYGDTQISPISSFWGGIITQEIVKLTGKFTPLKQWLHHEFFETLPEEGVARTITNDRYYDYHVIFGDSFVEKAQKSSSFIIGAGALGCEFIKMFALMGLSTKSGKMSVTDDDNIEISNLNRQFLFRRQHVGKNKCETACTVGKTINAEAKFNPLQLRVAPENENIFNDDFWTSLDFVVNAVDNVKARQYVDGQCVWFEKPLFESGTLGTKCHSQIIIPHATISYTDIIDPPEESIPLCTLKNFPYQIEHTIQWARDYFEGTFADPSADLVSFFDNRTGFLKQLQKQHKQNPTTLRVKLETLNKLYLANQTKSYQRCVELGMDIFQDVFNYQIKQLLTAFPADHVIEDTGKLFWSGLKRVPTPLEFDINDPIHLELVQAAANIYATLFKLPMKSNIKEVAELVKKVPLVPFKPKAGVKIETDEKKKDEPVVINDEDEEEAAKLLTILEGYELNPALKTNVVEFEKDDPTNFHIEFMGGVSNLRVYIVLDRLATTSSMRSTTSRSS